MTCLLQFSLSLYIIVLSIPSFGQSTTITVSKTDKGIIQMDKMNVGYQFLENPFSIYSKYDIEELEVSASHGVIKHIRENRFTIKEDSARSTTIQVRLKSGKLICEQLIRLKKIPSPIASIAGKSSTDQTVTAIELQKAAGVRAVMYNFDFDMKCSVTSFRCEVILADGMYRDLGISNTNRFSSGMKATFNQPISRVIFSEITCNMPTGSRTLSPLVLDVK